MDENTSNLDVEFKRYLQIIRPYLSQLSDKEAIQLCDAWVQRLQTCSANEKSLRNRYIFVLCCQLSKGILDMPFLKYPPIDDLPHIPDTVESDSSTEVEYVVIDADENSTKVLYEKNKENVENADYPTEFSAETNFEKRSNNDNSNENINLDDKGSEVTRKQTILCYTCPEIMRACAKEVSGNTDDQYEYRANNLIMRLREIKKQNALLHNELEALKDESKGKPYDACSYEKDCKVDTCTSAFICKDNSVTIKSLRTKLQEIQDDRQYLIDTLSSLQEQLDNFHEVKKLEFEDMEAKHKLEMIKIKTTLRDESKHMFTKKLEEMRQYYDEETAALKKEHESEKESIQITHELALFDKDKIIQEKTKELEEKDKILREKDTAIQDKDNEIASLKQQIEELNTQLQSAMSKILEKNNEDHSQSEVIKLKTHDLEKRLSRMEKSKAKCAKFFENKLAYIQREKHLSECSLQLQLVRQRAHVVNEITEEHQVELSEALEKLEAKYKDIVANVQSTAIQRRMQDQMALENILQASNLTRNDVSTHQSQFSGKTVTLKHNKDVIEGYDSEISGIIGNKANANKSYGSDSAGAGYCLDGERFGELFQRVHIPDLDK